MQRNRINRLAVIAALSLPLIQSQSAVNAQQITTAPQIVPVEAFLDGLGVNGHVSWPGRYPYSATERVAEAMAYLGVRNLRDHVNADTFPVFERLAAKGVRFNLLTHPKVDLRSHISWARRLTIAFPGSVVALEGPNEVDKWPVEFRGLSGPKAAAAMQQALYTSANADPYLADIPIYNLTVSGISRENSAELGDLSAYADYANVHPYYRAGQQSWGHSRADTRYTLRNYIISARWSAPGRPVVVTETGSSSSPASVIGVTEEVQAKQVLNSLLATARHGVRATYIYELVDSQNAGPRDVESHYGLFRYDWSPKPAADALGNLTRILRSPEGRALEGSAPPRFSLAGMPDTGASLLMVDENGVYSIVLWAEPDLWDEDSDRPIPAPAHTVSIDFGQTARPAALYDPLVSDRPLKTFSPSRRIEVSLTDHPLIVRLL